MALEDFKNSNGQWVKTATIEGKSRSTYSHMVWGGMLQRVKAKSHFLKSYVGCSVAEEFQDFQFFTDWHVGQVGYDMVGYELDKDLL